MKASKRRAWVPTSLVVAVVIAAPATPAHAALGGYYNCGSQYMIGAVYGTGNLWLSVGGVNTGDWSGPNPTEHWISAVGGHAGWITGGSTGGWANPPQFWGCSPGGSGAHNAPGRSHN